MRTRVTFDDDVAAGLQQLRARKDRPFNHLVNDVLRAGLAHLDREEAAARGAYTRAVSLGRLRVSPVDDVSEALVVAEGDAHR